MPAVACFLFFRASKAAIRHFMFLQRCLVGIGAGSGVFDIRPACPFLSPRYFGMRADLRSPYSAFHLGFGFLPQGGPAAARPAACSGRAYSHGDGADYSRAWLSFFRARFAFVIGAHWICLLVARRRLPCFFSARTGERGRRARHAFF